MTWKITARKAQSICLGLHIHVSKKDNVPCRALQERSQPRSYGCWCSFSPPIETVYSILRPLAAREDPACGEFINFGSLLIYFFRIAYQKHFFQ